MLITRSCLYIITPYLFVILALLYLIKLIDLDWTASERKEGGPLEQAGYMRGGDILGQMDAWYSMRVVRLWRYSIPVLDAK